MTESRMQGFAAGRYAAIDIGTVTCRMLVADVDAAGAIHEVDREYAITNLGEGVDATGMLLPAAIDRTVETVGGYCAVRDRAGRPHRQDHRGSHLGIARCRELR